MIDAGSPASVGLIESALLALDSDALEAALTRGGAGDGNVESVLVPALERLGQSWERGEIALSQLYMSGRICERLVERLFPFEESEHRESLPRLAIAVLEDYHLLGKRIVGSMLRSAGYALRDYGRTSVEELVALAVGDGIDVLFVSALMLPSALRVRDLCAALRARSPGVKVMVGGAPFRLDEGLWREVGADAMGATASDALAFIRGLEKAKA